MRHTFRVVVTEPVAPDTDVVVSDADAHHLLRVVRRDVGDDVEIIDGAGQIWPATISARDPHCRLRTGGAPRPAPGLIDVVLAIGLAEPGRLDLVVEKAAELGVREVIVFASERARRVPTPEAFTRRRDRMTRVAEASARQSGRAGMTTCEGLVAFADVLTQAQNQGYLLDARGDVGLRDALASSATASSVIIVGPDTGFSSAEVDAARAAGVTVCRTGMATLRMETAAIAAAVMAADAHGQLGAD